LEATQTEFMPAIMENGVGLPLFQILFLRFSSDR
jgi:hypothetical protein